jgi:hypothetical protein
MGDHFQVIVDRDATADQAKALAEQVLSSLVEGGIVLATPTDCTLGEPGYPPGPRYHDAVTLPHAYRIGSEGQRIREDDLTRILRTNGLEISTSRTVFHAGGYGCNVTCRACGTTRDDDDPAWGDALEEWYRGRGNGTLTCPRCGHSEPVTEWSYDPPWGFGHLGFTFWNWPPLKDEFVAEVGKLLRHRTVVVAGKL